MSDDLIIDTHGEAIIDPVYDLFEWTIKRVKPVPVLLERDINVPELSDIESEMNSLRTIIKQNVNLISAKSKVLK